MVKEGSDIVLPCSLGFDGREKMFIWRTENKEVFSYDPAYKSDIYGKGQRSQNNSLEDESPTSMTIWSQEMPPSRSTKQQ